MRLLLEKGHALLILFAIFINTCGTILKRTFYCIMEPMELRIHARKTSWIVRKVLAGSSD